MDRPNVLLVVLDSVRAQNVGLYGYHRDTTPFLTSFAEEATVYTQARAPGIHSVASHASLWTGSHVESHEVVRHEDQLKTGTTIWEELSEQGYETGIFTTNAVVAHASNLADPFDQQVTDEVGEKGTKPFPEAHGPNDVAIHEGLSGNLKRSLSDDYPIRSLFNSAHHFFNQQRDHLRDDLTTEDLVTAFSEWRREESGPWAACLNLMDAHFPYEPDEVYDHWGGPGLRELHADMDKPPANEFIGGRPWWKLEAFEHLYDGAIRQLDEYVKRIIAGLEGDGELGETLVVITSDHGEGFGEISRLTGTTRLIDHSWGIHEALTHVPLVVKYPGQKEKRRVNEPSSLVAFPSTVRDLLGADDVTRSFVPEQPVVTSTTRLRKEDDEIFQNSAEDPSDYYGPWRAIYEADGAGVRKTALRKGESLEVQIDSPRELCVIGEGSSEDVEAVFDELEPSNVKQETSDELGDEVEQKLVDLGYLR